MRDRSTTMRPEYFCSCGYPFDKKEIILFPIKCPHCNEPYHKLSDLWIFDELYRTDPDFRKYVEEKKPWKINP